MTWLDDFAADTVWKDQLRAAWARVQELAAELGMSPAEYMALDTLARLYNIEAWLNEDDPEDLSEDPWR